MMGMALPDALSCPQRKKSELCSDLPGMNCQKQSVRLSKQLSDIDAWSSSP